MSTVQAVGVVVLAVLLLGGGLYLLVGDRLGLPHLGRSGVPGLRRRPARDRFRPDADDEDPVPLKQAGIVINPTKFDDLGKVRTQLNDACVRLGWAAPLIFLTTEEDPGFGQTRRALEADVDVVCALGGDGTVRAVAEVMSGTGSPMGLLPGGTGNLLARNLDLPVDDLGAALEIALSGRNRHIDVGWLEVDGDARHAFLVMAGLGFDADLMDATSEELKAKVGWAAYVASATRRLRDVRFRTKVSVDGGEPVVYRARTILVGNCGKLTGGIVLMPDADVDDGWLDVVALTPKNLASWARLAANVVARRDNPTPALDRYRGTEVVIETDDRQKVQIDGDVVGEAHRLRMTLTPRSLIVRVAS